MLYQTFIIRIDEWAAAGYPVHAFSDDFGEAKGRFCPDSITEELLQDMEDLAQGRTDHELLVRIGLKFYKALFHDEVESIFQKSCGKVELTKNLGLRLQLRIEPPELRVYPWELLYSPLMQEFLCIQVSYPLVRYFELPRTSSPLQCKLPLRLLVAIPNIPEGYAEFDVAKEKQLLSEALVKCANSVTVDYLQGESGVTLSDISDALMEKQYHCFHFIGHGEFQDDKGYLLFNDQQGNADAVDDRRFASLFRNHEDMRLIVLNSCKGAALSATEPLVGMAPKLLAAGVPAVIAMHYAIYDDVAKLFAREFYRSLFRGDNQGRVEYAISFARSRLEAEYPNERAVATPVLYMHAKDGILFHSYSGNKAKDLYLSTNAFDTSSIVEQGLNEAYAQAQTQAATGDQQARLDSLNIAQDLQRLKARIRLSRYLIVSSSMIILLILMFSWTRLFDIFGGDTMAESMVMWMADVVSETEFSEALLIVPVTKESIAHLKKTGFDSSWRQQHAQLIRKLADAGASVISFDLFFKRPSKFDAKLMQAIAYAEQKGTAVIAGIGRAEDIDLFPQFYKPLHSAQHVGSLCIGDKKGYAFIMPLWTKKMGTEQAWPSLALATWSAYQQKNQKFLSPLQHTIFKSGSQFKSGSRRAKPESITVYGVNIYTDEHPECNFIDPQDQVAELIIDLSPLEQLHNPAVRMPYHQVLDSSKNELTKIVKDRIILIGTETEKDWVNNVFRGLSPSENRSGLELQADALNTLLQGISIRPLGIVGEFLLIILMGAIGSLLVYCLPLQRRYWRIGLLLVSIIAYLSIALNVYINHRILLNMLYHISVLLLAYYIAVKLKRMVKV